MQNFLLEGPAQHPFQKVTDSKCQTPCRPPFPGFFGYQFLSNTVSELLVSITVTITSSCGNLVVPRTRRRIGNRAFSVAAPRAWNRLPMELKLLQSMDLFRRDLKTFLFHSVYGHQDTD